jgi:NADH-quinone oxidoreductase subunit K
MLPTLFLQVLSLTLFTYGFMGTFLIKRNLIMIIVCIELLLLAVQLNLVVTSFNFDDILGQLIILFILAIAAAEVAIGLTLVLVLFRLRGTVNTKHVYLTKG